MADHTGANLRRLVANFGLTLDQVAAQSQVDRRTIKAIFDGRHRPQPRTIKRLADGLGVAVDEFFLDPAHLLYRQFDRRTNPVVDEVVERNPELFADWMPADFDELYSRFGAGGPLTIEGTIETVLAMNGHREVHEKLAVLLESSQADVIRGIVELLYEKVTIRA